MNRAGCGLRRSPGLAVFPAPVKPEPARSLPAEPPLFERFAAVACALVFPALQSRGGDGLLALTPIGPVSTHRVPVHEGHGDCGGATAPAMGYCLPRFKSPASKQTELVTLQTTRSRAARLISRAHC